MSFLSIFSSCCGGSSQKAEKTDKKKEQMAMEQTLADAKPANKKIKTSPKLHSFKSPSTKNDALSLQSTQDNAIAKTSTKKTDEDLMADLFGAEIDDAFALSFGHDSAFNHEYKKATQKENYVPTGDYIIADKGKGATTSDFSTCLVFGARGNGKVVLSHIDATKLAVLNGHDVKETKGISLKQIKDAAEKNVGGNPEYFLWYNKDYKSPASENNGNTHQSAFHEDVYSKFKTEMFGDSDRLHEIAVQGKDAYGSTVGFDENHQLVFKGDGDANINGFENLK
ncbi:hypothetical protein JM93_00354 [Roseibium hamelinense]|uniref:Uncharacterized protein n=1 Tax=Roseibium hamelinense TaxID=150831 RepID=A0A562TGU1_9HYPH|nr:hypothetical protein [Roseibium hamelinense]MTI46004.1 hypothetical protein [Roseibium hamelinense]TWI92805.1 hypothetical protein JM93_00354 [Roseibium hamelinense]